MKRLIILLLLPLVLVSCQTAKEKKDAQLAALKKTNTLEAYNTFLQENYESSLRESVIYYRDKLVLDTAVSHQSIPMVRDFLRQYPESYWVEQAHHYLEHGFPDLSLDLGGGGLDPETCHNTCHLDSNEPIPGLGHPLEDMKELQTLAELEAFEKKYPNFKWNKETGYYRERVYLNEAIHSGSKEQIIQFLKDFPDSEWVDLAHYYLEFGFENHYESSSDNRETCHLACHGTGEYDIEDFAHPKTKIQDVKTVADYKAFRKVHPNYELDKSERYIRDLAYLNDAIKAGNRQSIIDFLNRFPNSELVEEAHYYLEHGFNEYEVNQDDRESCHLACHAQNVKPDDKIHR